MSPLRTHDEPPKPVEDLRAKSKLGPQKIFYLADTALSVKDEQNIVLRMARTGTELVLLNGGRVGDVATGIGGTLVLPPLNVDDVKHHFEEVKGWQFSYNQRFQRNE